MESNKNTMILLAVLLLVIAIAYPILKGDNPEPATSGVSLEGEAGTILIQIESVQLDTSVFENQTWKELKDWTAALPNLPVGKRNPFSP